MGLAKLGRAQLNRAWACVGQSTPKSLVVPNMTYYKSSRAKHARDKRDRA